jgi:two-component system sensor histidine kinase KdpD
VHVEDGAFDAYVNPVHFELIVLHLVRNVVKHTPEGTRAWVRFRSRPEGVEVAVDDDGPGVPEDAKASIFEPFEQSAAPKHAPGMGIGLTVVSYLAAAAGGRAWAEDRPGGGASFRVMLPQRVSARRAANV